MKYAVSLFAFFLLSCVAKATPRQEGSASTTSPPPLPCTHTVNRPVSMDCSKWNSYMSVCHHYTINYEDVCDAWGVHPDAGVP